MRLLTQGDQPLLFLAAFSLFLTTIASGGIGTIKLWDAMGKEMRPPIDNFHWGEIRSLAFCPDGKTLAWGGEDRSIKLWDMSRREQRTILRGHADKVFSVCYSPDGKTLAFGGEDKTIRLWDVVIGQERHSIAEAHKGWVHSVAFSLDGKTLATGGEDGIIKLWRAAAY